MSSKDYNTNAPQGFKGVHIPVPQKSLELRPLDELMAIVKSDFRKMDAEGLIDDGTCIKTVMACNDRLGIPIRDIKQICIPVENYKAKLPINFEKLFYVTALSATNGITMTMRNPFSNNFDRDAIYEAELDRGSLGNVDSYAVTIKRTENITVHSCMNFIDLGISSGQSFCHNSCPNILRKGRYMVSIEDNHIHTPFRTGELYIMYLATMEDEEGHLLFPFHPLITPYYEWSIKEKILQDALFNSDGAGLGDLYKLAQQERVKAWLEAYNVTASKEYGDYVDAQKRKEFGWYNQYFKYFK